MEMGTIRWFDHASGHGYVAPDAGGPDLYLHRVSVARELRLRLAAGDRLEFETRAGGIQLEAVNAISPAAQIVQSVQR